MLNTKPEPAEQQLLLTRRQAAHRLNMGVWMLKGLTDRGELPCIRVGKLVRYDEADLRAWIDQKKRDQRGGGDGEHRN